MRVTQIMLAKGFGGAERSFVDTAVALAGAGHEVQAVCHRRFVRRDALAPGVAVAPVEARTWWDPLAERAIRRHVAAFAPDVVHVHLARGAWLGGRAARALGVPVVSKLHNYVNLRYYRHVSHFVATTDDQRRYLLEHGVEATRISVIPNFSSLEPVAAAREATDAPPRFVACGRLKPEKGFDVLLEAFRAYVDDGGAGSLVVGGDGPERAALEQRGARLGLGDRVEMVGWVDDVGALLDRGDVLVLPSRRESFGIVLLEAMARGVPIVTTRTRGPAQVVDDETALFAEPGDPASLAAALRSAERDPAGRAARARAALARFVERYHRDRVVPRLVALYGRCAAGAATPVPSGDR